MPMTKFQHKALKARQSNLYKDKEERGCNDNYPHHTTAEKIDLLW
jgi:hypothetical protein